MTITMNVELDEFTVCHSETEDDVVFRSNGGDDIDRIIGDDAGKLLIRLGVDGALTIVSADTCQTAPLTLIERGIAALSEIRDQMERMAPDESRKGRCLAFGDWGRCGARGDHAGDHQFPTESDWCSLNNVPVSA